MISYCLVGQFIEYCALKKNWLGRFSSFEVALLNVVMQLMRQLTMVLSLVRVMYFIGIVSDSKC